MRWLPLAVLLTAAPTAAAQAPGDASDFIVAVQTPAGEPIAGATVLVGDRGASTDADGQAVVEGLAPGRYRVRVSFLGRQPRELAARLDAPGPWGLIVELAEAAISLDDVVVTATDLSRSRLAADGFFDRLELSSGTVYTYDDLERRNPITLADAVRGALGVRVRPTPTGAVATTESGGEECVMAVFIDGQASTYATENLEGLPAADLVALEVYRRPSQVPLRYNQLGLSDGCGVVLAWTALSLEDRS